MNTKRILLLLILVATIAQPLSAKKRNDVTPDTLTKKELMAKYVKIGRALLDMAGGLTLMHGATYDFPEDGYFDLIRFESFGISLFAHGAYNLYKDVKYQDLKNAYSFLNTYIRAKVAAAQAALKPAVVQAEAAVTSAA